MRSLTLPALLAFVSATLADDAETTDEISPSDSRKLRTGKIILILVIGFATFAASAMPWFLRRLRQAAAVMHVLSCFAGGVMIGAALCHMFPDVSEAFEEYFAMAGTSGLVRPEDAGYPFAFLIAGSVVIMLLAVDKGLAHRWVNAHQGPDGNSHSHSHAHAHSYTPNPQAEEPPPILEPSFCPAGDSPFAPVEGSVVHVEVDGAVPPSDTPVVGIPEIELERGKQKHILEAYLFFVALSIHSIFDGLSVGAEQELSGFYALMIALVTHKLLDGFALGVPVFYARLPLFHTLFALIFCASMTPLGIGIGWAATATMNGARATLARAIIVSISAGSFLFIAFIEMLPAAFEHERYILLKIISCFLGFGLMAIIALWV
eukprot:TRINITY_DN17457_c0_g1_i1.p1 TRINITY_DN17457_c0_g1~~TRINITY_DN17457_c0_g1_i1.p1  ORF type:complete len:384 (+),score=54.14 TRINITY_DN17457_c0_g1_i1:27-1154(+)